MFKQLSQPSRSADDRRARRCRLKNCPRPPTGRFESTSALKNCPRPPTGRFDPEIQLGSSEFARWSLALLF